VYNNGIFILLYELTGWQRVIKLYQNNLWLSDDV